MTHQINSIKFNAGQYLDFFKKVPKYLQILFKREWLSWLGTITEISILSLLLL